MTLPETIPPRDDDDVIRFYDKTTYYYDFTPYAQVSVKIERLVWPTLNHYYQAEKVANGSLRYMIKDAPTAAMATYMTHDSFHQFTSPLSLLQKRRVMQTGLEAKFQQHPYLKDKLIATENKKLLFVHPTDMFWGTGGYYRKKGKNVLGELLMELRCKLTANDSSEGNVQNSNLKLRTIGKEILSSDEKRDNQTHVKQPDQLSVNQNESQDSPNSEDTNQRPDIYRMLFNLIVALISLLVFVFFIL